jgi:hypothetical protein
MHLEYAHMHPKYVHMHLEYAYMHPDYPNMHPEDAPMHWLVTLLVREGNQMKAGLNHCRRVPT